MKTKILENGEWIEGSPTYFGQIYRKYFDAGGFSELIYTNHNSSLVEKEWVSLELLRTDSLVLLPDFPHTEKVIEYRKSLRSYDLSGDRPAAPTTPKGTLI